MKKILFAIVLLSLSVVSYGQTAKAWLTSPATRQLLEEQNELQFASRTATPQCITINNNIEYQTIDGFGWMVNEGGAKLFKTRLQTDERQALLREFYDPAEGLGAQVVRISIGASDMSERPYTYSPSKDETLSNFSLNGPDKDYVIPVLKEILAINPDIRIMAVPWTAPVWMKQNTKGRNGYMGGTLRTEYYALYAQYFVKYIQAMEAEGIHIWAVSPQNEPLHDGNNPSMTFTQETEYTFVNNHLGPALEAAGYGDVLIVGYDHNCDNTNFPVRVAKSNYVSGSAFHLYGGDISAMKRVYDLSHKDVFFTEQYTGANGDFGGDYTWHMQNVMLGSMENMSRCAIEWNIAADINSEPHTDGGCSDCKGAVTVDNAGISSRNVSYYIVGTMSRVTQAGAVRIGATGASQFKHVAFRNPDGSLGIVAFNTGAKQSLSISLNNKVVTYTVPSGAAVSILVPDAFTPSGIVSVETTPVSSPSYSPSGLITDKRYKGVIINNGKKTISK